MTALRVFFIGGALSYRALFNWIRPVVYATTMLGSPLFQILFFTYLGRHTAGRPDEFFIVGNAVQVSAMSGLYAGTMTVGNERFFGTLAPLLATPANRVALFAGRALPVIANGLVVSAFGFAVGWLALGLHIDGGQLPALAAVVVVSASACSAFGLMLGSIGLRARDVLFASNLLYFLMLLLCGVNVPLDALPGWMAAIGRCLPITHGAEAAREVTAGAAFGEVAGLVATEAAIGVAYGVAAYALFRALEWDSRRRATLETA